jgi:sec-independent protein translocase protein TatA
VKLLNPWDLLIVAFVLVLIFGPKRLPQAGRSLGSSIRSFKDALTERHDRQDAEAEAEATAPAQLPPAQAATPAEPALEPRERDTVL